MSAERMAHDDAAYRDGRRKMALRRARGRSDPSADERRNAGLLIATVSIGVMAALGYAFGGPVLALILGGGAAGLIGLLRWLFR